jgi:DNA-binding CsgD family transcriptional regulator
MGTGHLREGDADLLLAVIETARHDEPGPAVPWSLLHGLLRLVPCDLGVSYQAHDFRQRRRLFLQAAEEDGSGGVEAWSGPTEQEERFWRFWWSSICSWPQRTGDLRSVIHTGDFYGTDRALRADPMHAEVLTDITGELIVSLPAPPGESRRLLFMRSDGTPFSERDRQVLELLRPHLYEVWLDAERLRAGVPPLSPREWEVLALGAAGLSRAEIAAALWISVGTVRTHLEHIRTKLGVHSSAAAAAKALPYAPTGLFPPVSRGR